MSSCTGKLEILLTIFSLSLIPQVNSNYQCDKYCHQDCPKPDFSNNDFSDCVDANIYCSCGLPPTVKIVLGIFGAFIGIVIISCCCAALKRTTTRGQIYHNNLPINTNTTSVAQTVRPTPYYLQPAYANNPAFVPSAPIYSSGGGFLPTVPTTYGYNNEAGPPSYDQAIMTNDSKPYPSGS